MIVSQLDLTKIKLIQSLIRLKQLNKDKINSIINKIEAAKLDITILDNLKDFLVVYITKEDDSHMHMFQLDLINQINKQAF